MNKGSVSGSFLKLHAYPMKFRGEAKKGFKSQPPCLYYRKSAKTKNTYPTQPTPETAPEENAFLSRAPPSVETVAVAECHVWSSSPPVLQG